MACQQTIVSCETKKTRSLHGPPMFDIVASAGVHPGQSALQHFPLPDKSGLFADMLGHLDFNVSGGTLSPKLLSVQLQNLGHLFDDLDKAGSDVSECPDTPLHLFPHTPTSDLLLQGHFNHFFPEAQTPPQMTPSPPMRCGRGGQDSQQLSLETSIQQSPISSLMGDSRAHSMPNPLPSPMPVRSPGPYSPAHSHQPRLDHHSPMNSRTVSMPLPPLMDGYRFPPPVRTSMHEGSPSARHSPGRPAGIRKVSAGQQGRAKVTGRRTQLLSQSARAELRRAGSGKSEDSMSAAATDSEADSITTDGGSHKRKPGSKKGAGRRARRMTCRNCATHQTPQWRCGPEGPRTLCNACGVRYKKGLPLTNSWAGKSAGMPPSGVASAMLPPLHKDSPSIV
ncbi:probable GATA transcription factor 12 at C-terminar half [Coccomyxa sp. Obi]|nr:probable GATA transcription factor 12 at C-terminar half [Coccomyxa sp. Obi]